MIFYKFKMKLGTALLSYLGVIVGSYIILLYFNYTFFAAFVLTLIIGLIYINIVFPMTRNELDDVNSSTVLYIFIQIFTVIVFIIYALLTTIGESRNKKKFPMKYYDI